MNEPPFGFNLFGYASGNLGIGVTARNICRLFQDHALPFVIVDLDPGLNRGGYDLTFSKYFLHGPSKLPYAINLFILPPADLGALLKANPELIQNPAVLNAAFSMWELPQLPDAYSSVLQQMDVAIAESDFIYQTYANHLSNVHTIRAQHPLYFERPIAPDRQRFGLPENDLIFLTGFEPYSDLQRKNPYATIQAFEEAFPYETGKMLVIKVNNAFQNGQIMPDVQSLIAHTAHHPQIRIFLDRLSYPDTLSLYSTCDVYVSLHRAEGLGLGPMEAMALGKPVIATGWSGNMTYMNFLNACPVQYSLIPVQGMTPAYARENVGADAVWADPNIHDAAIWMQRLAASPETRAAIGQKAQLSLQQFQETAQKGNFIAEIQSIWEQKRFTHSLTAAPLTQPFILKKTSIARDDLQVDVVIPIYGQADLASRCIHSLLQTSSHVHLILVDDTSPGRDISALFDHFKSFPQITLACTGKNLGFIGACKLGASLGSAPFLLFLNSDTEAIAPEWIPRLIPQAEQVAICGAKLLYPPHFPGPFAGTLQHAGIARNSQGIPYHPFLGWPADSSEANTLREVNAVTGACFLIRRRVWEELGGWDSQFGRGVYEDVDLCWQARHKGYKVIYQPEVVLYHAESASKAADGSHSLNAHTQENLQKLLKKWQPIQSDEALFFGEKTVRKWERARAELQTVEHEWKQGHVKQALVSARQAASTAPDCPEVLVIYAQLLETEGKINEAIQNYRKVIRLTPAAWPVRLRLVDILKGAGKDAEAANELAALKAVFPQAPEVTRREADLCGTPAHPTSAEKLRSLLEAEDLLAALQAQEADLDEELLALVRENAEAARQTNDLALFEGLNDLSEYIQQVLMQRKK